MNQPAKHASLFFHDGDIILSAADKHGQIVLFKPHRSLLTHHSLVFRHMLGVPPASDNWMYEGYMRVELSDKAEDLDYFLSFLYNPNALRASSTSSAVGSALRMATKYQTDDLCTRLIEHIKADWPQTLEQWDSMLAEVAALNTEEQQPDVQYSPTTSPTTPSFQRLPDPCASIALASEFDIPCLLPAAFYTLACAHPDPRLQSEMNPASVPAPALAAHRPARWERLPPGAFFRLVRGQWALRNWLAEHVRGFGPAFNCADPQRCQPVWAQAEMSPQAVAFEMLQPDILAVHKRVYEKMEQREEDLCIRCRHCVAENRDGREKIWAQLPSWFQVDL